MKIFVAFSLVYFSNIILIKGRQTREKRQDIRSRERKRMGTLMVSSVRAERAETKL